MPTFLRTNAKTGAHAPQEVTSIDWQHPMLRHCTSIVVNIGPNPVRFDRDYSNPQQPTVDNSSGDVTTEKNSVTGTLSKRFSGDATNDRVRLGSITSDDPWSFFGQTSASVICHIKRDGFGNSNFPRFVDKSNSGNAANGWGVWWSNDSTDKLVFGIDGTGQSVAVNWPTENSTNVFGFNVTNVPLSGTATVTLEAFSDGTSIGTGSRTSMPQFPATTVNAAIGNWNHTSDRMFDGFIDYVAIFDRAIPASQHAMFGHTPFAFMRTSERTYFLPATTPPSSSAPIYLYHHRHRNRAA